MLYRIFLPVFFLFAVTFPAFSSMNTYYVSQSDGDNSNGGKSQNDAWRDLRSAMSQVYSDAADTVLLILDDGPFHLASYDTTTNVWSGYNRPHLIIAGNGMQTITGVDSVGGWLDDWVPVIGSDYLEQDWPAVSPGDSTYAFDYNIALLGQDWINKVAASEDSIRPSYANDIPFDGRFLIRRELLCYEDRTGATLSYEKYNLYPDEFIVEDEPGDGYFSVDFWETASARSVHILSSESEANLDDPTKYKWYIPAMDDLFWFTQVRSVTLKNLRFTHTTGHTNQAAVNITSCTNVTIDNCHFDNNNGRGLHLSNCSSGYTEQSQEWDCDLDADYDAVKITNSTFNGNGSYGLSAAHCTGVTIEDCDINYNNWAAYRAGTMDWDCGGAKLFACRRVRVDTLTVKSNQGVGLWIDQDGRDMQIDSLVSKANYSAGLVFELTREKIMVNDGVLYNNGVKPDANQVVSFTPASLVFAAVDSIVMNNLTIDQAGSPDTFPVGLYLTHGVISEYVTCSETEYDTLGWGKTIFNDCVTKRYSSSELFFHEIGYDTAPNDTLYCNYFDRVFEGTDCQWWTGATYQSSTPPTALQTWINANCPGLPLLLELIPD